MSWTTQAMTSNIHAKDTKVAITRQLLDLAKNGMNILKHEDISEALSVSWIGYSEKIIEISTKDFDPNIYLGYLRLLLQIRHDPAFGPYQKLSACVEYIIGVTESLLNN